MSGWQQHSAISLPSFTSRTVLSADRRGRWRTRNACPYIRPCVSVRVLFVCHRVRRQQHPCRPPQMQDGAVRRLRDMKGAPAGRGRRTLPGIALPAIMFALYFQSEHIGIELLRPLIVGAYHCHMVYFVQSHIIFFCSYCNLILTVQTLPLRRIAYGHGILRHAAWRVWQRQR